MPTTLMQASLLPDPECNCSSFTQQIHDTTASPVSFLSFGVCSESRLTPQPLAGWATLPVSAPEAKLCPKNNVSR